MRILLVLTCCFGLAFFAGAAQPDDPNHNQGKKKGGSNAPSQVAAPQTGKVYKAGPGGGHHNMQPTTATNYKATGKTAKWQGPVTSGRNPTNLSGQTNVTAKSTKFNKSMTVNKNTTVNKNFKVQHFNLGNQPSGKYQAVKFNGNYQIAGAHNWQGSKYVVFQNYHPQWHDQGWWRSHHNNIVFVFGAPYYWDSGYWYPAWGYNPGANYYYDGPIYASNPEMDPGQTVANVQAALQQQGYYQGEVDGILGPQTRAALAEYQSAQGLEPTGAVDEPTLETLGMV
jgi:Putative peptidoglycan binding domain